MVLLNPFLCHVDILAFPVFAEKQLFIETVVEHMRPILYLRTCVLFFNVFTKKMLFVTGFIKHAGPIAELGLEIAHCIHNVYLPKNSDEKILHLRPKSIMS